MFNTYIFNVVFEHRMLIITIILFISSLLVLFSDKTKVEKITLLIQLIGYGFAFYLIDILFKGLLYWFYSF